MDELEVVFGDAGLLDSGLCDVVVKRWCRAYLEMWVSIVER